MLTMVIMEVGIVAVLVVSGGDMVMLLIVAMVIIG